MQRLVVSIDLFAMFVERWLRIAIAMRYAPFLTKVSAETIVIKTQKRGMVLCPVMSVRFAAKHAPLIHGVFLNLLEKRGFASKFCWHGPEHQEGVMTALRHGSVVAHVHEKGDREVAAPILLN